ncbi:MAG TPA: glycosyltransferase [Clostridiales bacterium]|nr:glycosyltransferase [Clostridiales bacterium]
MFIVLLYFIFVLAGFVLFSKTLLSDEDRQDIKSKPPPGEYDLKASVIIPARNEESNMPHILKSLMEQTLKPYEIIVVDDFSTDRTREIAESYGVKVISGTPLPDGWTGKNWALWNGYLQSTGDVLVFLDADVRLAPDALRSLLAAREEQGGVISVIPYHYTEKFYERLSLVLNILGLFAFTSPVEKRSSEKGLYGPCIVAARKDYERINGHSSVKADVLDDVSLGKKFSEAGIEVNNYIGCDLVSFRMYPNGLKSEIEGFGKSAALGTAAMQPGTIFLAALWVIGLLTSGVLAPILMTLRHPSASLFIIGYLLYCVQIFYFVRYTGYYGVVLPILHFIPSLFFLYVMLYSLYKVSIVGSVPWRGREIQIGGKKVL